jgi:hypothetical protein
MNSVDFSPISAIFSVDSFRHDLLVENLIPCAPRKIYPMVTIPITVRSCPWVLKASTKGKRGLRGLLQSEQWTVLFKGPSLEGRHSSPPAPV